MHKDILARSVFYEQRDNIAQRIFEGRDIFARGVTFSRKHF